MLSCSLLAKIPTLTVLETDSATGAILMAIIMPSVSQSVTTLHMLLHAIDATSQQLQL